MGVEIYIPVKEKAGKPLTENEKSRGVFAAIGSRRSIRNYKNTPIQEDDLRKIIQAGILAPSGMNRQPWKFYVIRGEKRNEMVIHLLEGLENREKEGVSTSGARHSFDVMAQAPVTIFIYRPNRISPWLAASMDQHFRDLVDVQSIGAAIENMILTAEDMGIGSLWVCDVFSARQEIDYWLGEKNEMIAAVCFGYADEHPVARKRRPAEETLVWL